ncbi:MAG: hypothetical protein EBX52_09580, partial [Proteobacteria bacterium]|nr:hypothetical protein [Pseudomonadota bacterium]
MKKKSIPVLVSARSLASTRIEQNPFPGGRHLRAHFEQIFKDPHRAGSDRFCWDYWTVPGQYRLLRTPASSFFPKPLFQSFLSELLSWGRNHLGCQMISHPWLSAYVDGCHQNLHSDVPHGPFSFVYSLTPWKSRSFTGGETLIAKPKLLRYFSEIRHDRSHEESDFIDSVAQPMGRLTVFDPRYPHGVRAVQGVDSILDSRLVIHGWFTEPRPMLEGALTFKKILKPMDAYAHGILETVSGGSTHSGLLTLRIEIADSGAVSRMTVLAAHLPDAEGRLLSANALRALLAPESLQFPRARGKSILTLPL